VAGKAFIQFRMISVFRPFVVAQEAPFAAAAVDVGFGYNG
jgi:hypothetical protein